MFGSKLMWLLTIACLAFVIWMQAMWPMLGIGIIFGMLIGEAYTGWASKVTIEQKDDAIGQLQAELKDCDQREEWAKETIAQKDRLIDHFQCKIGRMTLNLGPADPDPDWQEVTDRVLGRKPRVIGGSVGKFDHLKAATSSTFDRNDGEERTLHKALFKSVEMIDPLSEAERALAKGTFQDYRPMEPRCPYCQKSDVNWRDKDLLAGRRSTGDGVEYHCYGGYCMD